MIAYPSAPPAELENNSITVGIGFEKIERIPSETVVTSILKFTPNVDNQQEIGTSRVPELSDANNVETSYDPNKNMSLKTAVLLICAKTHLFARFFYPIINVVLVVIPHFLIYFGASNITNCPYNFFIPLYILIAGLLGVAIQFFNFIFHEKRKVDNSVKKTEHTDLIRLFQNSIDIIIGLWCIIGGCIILSINEPKSFSSIDPDYCDKNTFLISVGCVNAGILFLFLFPISAIISIMLYIKINGICEPEPHKLNLLLIIGDVP